METITSIKPLIAVLVSICVVPLLVLCKKPNIRETWTFAAAAVKLLLVLSMLPVILNCWVKYRLLFIRTLGCFGRDHEWH